MSENFVRAPTGLTSLKIKDLVFEDLLPDETIDPSENAQKPLAVPVSPWTCLFAVGASVLLTSLAIKDFTNGEIGTEQLRAGLGGLLFAYEAYSLNHLSKGANVEYFLNKVRGYFPPV